MTIKHNMIDGLDSNKVKLVSELNRAERPDNWWQGKMTKRTTPQVSRRANRVKVKLGSHICSDIGEVPVKDRNGNKYYVLFKDMCSQYRIVYRMKKKDELVNVWKQFIADHTFQDVNGKMYCRIQ